MLDEQQKQELGLEKQVTEEGAKEAAEYDKFACFCKEQADNKQYAVEKSTDKIEEMAAEIEKLTGEITDLDAEVLKLGERITAIEGEVDDEKKARKTEFEDYVKADKNVTEAIEQVGHAIKSLKESKGKMSDGAKVDLQQVAQHALLSLPTDGKHAQVLGLLADAAPGEPASYEFKSNDIIATLRYLQKTFKEEKTTKDEEEFKSASASDKKLLALINEKKFKDKSKIEKEELSAEKTKDKTTLEEDKTQEEADKKADGEFLDELTTNCQDKAKEWDQRSQSRSAELTAMSEAIGILKEGVVSNYDANKKLVGLASKSAAVHRLRGSSAARQAPVSLLQLQSEEDAKLAGIHKAMVALATSADKLNSPLLSVLRAKVEMQGDHFEKVRGLIKDLIARLEAQATEEADQKSYCDKEMTKAVSSRDEESGNIEDEKATISSKEAKKVELKQEIADLSREIADLNKALKEATELRANEKEDNEGTIAKAEDGKIAVDKAIEVLEAYYNAGGFAQVAAEPKLDREGNAISDLAPKTSFSGDYKGNQEGSKGVIGLLNVISSDFERTKTTVEEEEKEAVTKFDKFKTDTETDIDDKKKSVTDKEGEVTTVEGDIVDAKDALETAEGLHSSAVKELEKLKAMCVEGEESYAERKKKRQQEIAALREAMQILADWKN